MPVHAQTVPYKKIEQRLNKVREEYEKVEKNLEEKAKKLNDLKRGKVKEECEEEKEDLESKICVHVFDILISDGNDAELFELKNVLEEYQMENSSSFKMLLAFNEAYTLIDHNYSDERIILLHEKSITAIFT
ncbi:15109_t:CDS:2 [Funneliformis mosseae]|uniref:15109_t:CDS:1 n=1 Tax=Funneliformis mosseae TaxID=27381 RepID=A0A9N9A1W9_FUNMO|nr:15109_t:CDS:2 [Funneliformis mosseae]